MNNIKALRKAREMTQKELSLKSGVPLRTIEDWEGNRRPPTNVYQLHKIAIVLECTIEDLLIFEEE